MLVSNQTDVVFVILIQDAQHREAMGSLRTADRSSLISEIHQLRGQLEQLHQTYSHSAGDVLQTFPHLLIRTCNIFITLLALSGKSS